MQYLSDRSVAERYEISRATVWRWVSEGRLPQPVKLSGGSTRWLLSSLERFEADKGSSSTTPTSQAR